VDNPDERDVARLPFSRRSAATSPPCEHYPEVDDVDSGLFALPPAASRMAGRRRWTTCATP
jgi:hypothetical protein